ncbi:MAG: rod shape-determining protein MreD [Verrucomicrobiota bacterium]|nr:rod shape-determining protein MreD [Verrucomicrobiota bacterium]
MTIIALLIGLFIALLFKTSMGPSGLFHGVRPEIISCLIAYAGMSCSLTTIIIFSFLAGIIQDALSNNLMGISAFAYVSIGMMIHTQRHILYHKGLIPIMLTGAVATFWVCTISYLLVSILQRGGFYWSISISEIILYTSIVNLFLTPVVFWMINIFRKIKLPKKNRRKMAQ